MASNSGDEPLAGGSSGEKEGQTGEGAAGGAEGLSGAQATVLERCIRALREAKKDSQTLAALLLITRLCPASKLDPKTLKQIFSAIGLNLPARLLVTAFKGGCENTGLTQHDVLSLATSLLAALSTDPEDLMSPHILSPLSVLLRLVSVGTDLHESSTLEEKPAYVYIASHDDDDDQTLDKEPMGSSSGGASNSAAEETPKLDHSIAADCYQVLTAVAAHPQGVDHLLMRRAVPRLCQALELKQTLSYEKGVPLLISIFIAKQKETSSLWGRHINELFGLLSRLAKEFQLAGPQKKLDMCSQLVYFLPGLDNWSVCESLKTSVRRIWDVLRTILQCKLTPLQIQSVLVLSGFLVNLYGWRLVGPPKFCCLLVNRACVEVRVALEVLTEEELGPGMVQMLTACYLIMEAAIKPERTFDDDDNDDDDDDDYDYEDENEEEEDHDGEEEEEEEGHHITIPSVSLQQSRQVLTALEGAYSSIIFYLKKVGVPAYRDPFIFVTFRCLSCWLSEENYCLEEDVFELLPFLINYSRHHFQGSMTPYDLELWIYLLAIHKKQPGWAGYEPLRYILPCVSHLSAEDEPRKILLDLDTQGLLLEFFQKSWISMKESAQMGWGRNFSMEKTCSIFISFILTERERAGCDPCFKALEAVLYEAIPLLVNKPCLVVLTAHCCTIGLLLGTSSLASSAPLNPDQRRFLFTILRFLRNALDWTSSPTPMPATWNEHWLDVVELWRLCHRSLSDCIKARPALAAVLREDGWLRYTLMMLDQCSSLPDIHTQEALEEALCSVAAHCPLAKQEIGNMMTNNGGVLDKMPELKKSLK